MSIYYYKLTNDDGGAPCVHDGLWSLGICKPRIRVAAGRWDLIFGFGGKRLGERLIYVAEVVKKTDRGEYYRDPAFADRPDRIYEWNGERLRWRPGSRFHPDGKWAAKDVGTHPRYERSYVLLSTDFRYYGDAGTDEWKARCPHLLEVFNRLTQGERQA